jgi:DNA modification methylase
MNAAPQPQLIIPPFLDFGPTRKEPHLLFGDCILRMREIPDNSITFVYATLPYAILPHDWDQLVPFPPLWEQLHRIVEPGAAICFLTNEDQSPDGFPRKLIDSNQSEYWNTIHWVKPEASGPGLIRSRMEDLHIFVKGGGRPTHYYEQRIGATKPRKAFRADGKAAFRHIKMNGWSGHSASNGTDGRQSSVWFGPQDRDSLKTNPDKHDSPNPPELAEFAIRTFTPEPEKPEDGMGVWVLDPTMGCASTGSATLNCGRRFAGCEKDQKWYDAAVRVMARAGYGKDEGYEEAKERFGGFQHEGMYFERAKKLAGKVAELEAVNEKLKKDLADAEAAQSEVVELKAKLRSLGKLI